MVHRQRRQERISVCQSSLLRQCVVVYWRKHRIIIYNLGRVNTWENVYAYFRFNNALLKISHIRKVFGHRSSDVFRTLTLSLWVSVCGSTTWEIPLSIYMNSISFVYSPFTKNLGMSSHGCVCVCVSTWTMRKASEGHAGRIGRCQKRI